MNKPKLRPFFMCLLVQFAFSPAISAQEGRTLGTSPSSDARALDEMRRELRAQREEIERLRATLAAQMRLIEELRARVEARSATTTPSSAVADPVEPAVERTGARGLATGANGSIRPVSAERSAAGEQGAPVRQDVEARLARVEAESKRTGEVVRRQLGSISFSGDLRLRYESFYGQVNAQPSLVIPGTVGNELSARHRLRVRARLALRGTIGRDLAWGLRFATGSYADAISSNQTLTDFFNRKPFALDQAFVAWTPKRFAGLKLQGGKFEAPWLRTEMTFDDDLQFEGFSQSYTKSFETGTVRELAAVAWQLPFLERNATLVVDQNGKLNPEESRRAGRDLALFGAQARARLAFGERVRLTLAAANLYFAGTQFITPAQFFGNGVQLPVAVKIPATATTPAQTVAAQVVIPRELLVAGNGNLGLSTATNNAVNRDGRLASGFNLVDLIGKLELTHSRRLPVTLIFNSVVNTRTRPVTVAGPDGRPLVLPNDEGAGYWAELQVGKTRERGDVLFGYTLMRIEKDAVLTPFNFSDIERQSDVRAHRFVFGYAADSRVVISLTGIITQRMNGLLGVFGNTPPGSLQRATTRLQLDTIFRF